MKNNPRKCITRIGSGHHPGTPRVVLDLNGLPSLFVETSELSIRQLETLASGYVYGFKSGGLLSPEFIEMLLQDPLEIADLQIPLSVVPDERALFRRGMIAALGLVAQGYWLETEGPSSVPSKADVLGARRGTRAC